MEQRILKNFELLPERVGSTITILL